MKRHKEYKVISSAWFHKNGLLYLGFERKIGVCRVVWPARDIPGQRGIPSPGRNWAEAWRHQIIVLLPLGSVGLQCSLIALES